MAQPLIDAEAQAQRRLDIETQNGELEAKLIEWERQIEKDLTSLDRFRARTATTGGDQGDAKAAAVRDDGAGTMTPRR